ncbi:hypothetical protein NECID01_1659 [Nematocida sp. AWRm77]|nr:hypothetical protein NECID01_1659 [Nematocida sp. AWRm77]
MDFEKASILLYFIVTLAYAMGNSNNPVETADKPYQISLPEEIRDERFPIETNQSKASLQRMFAATNSEEMQAKKPKPFSVIVKDKLEADLYIFENKIAPFRTLQMPEVYDFFKYYRNLRNLIQILLHQGVEENILTKEEGDRYREQIEETMKNIVEGSKSINTLNDQGYEIIIQKNRISKFLRFEWNMFFQMIKEEQEKFLASTAHKATPPYIAYNTRLFKKAPNAQTRPTYFEQLSSKAYRAIRTGKGVLETILKNMKSLIETNKSQSGERKQKICCMVTKLAYFLDLAEAIQQYYLEEDREFINKPEFSFYVKKKTEQIDRVKEMIVDMEEKDRSRTCTSKQLEENQEIQKIYRAYIYYACSLTNHMQNRILYSSDEVDSKDLNELMSKAFIGLNQDIPKDFGFAVHEKYKLRQIKVVNGLLMKQKDIFKLLFSIAEKSENIKKEDIKKHLAKMEQRINFKSASIDLTKDLSQEVIREWIEKAFNIDPNQYSVGVEDVYENKREPLDGWADYLIKHTKGRGAGATKKEVEALCKVQSNLSHLIVCVIGTIIDVQNPQHKEGYMQHSKDLVRVLPALVLKRLCQRRAKELGMSFSNTCMLEFIRTISDIDEKHNKSFTDSAIKWAYPQFLINKKVFTQALQTLNRYLEDIQNLLDELTEKEQKTLCICEAIDIMKEDTIFIGKVLENNVCFQKRQQINYLLSAQDSMCAYVEQETKRLEEAKSIEAISAILNNLIGVVSMDNPWVGMGKNLVNEIDQEKFSSIVEYFKKWLADTKDKVDTYKAKHMEIDRKYMENGVVAIVKIGKNITKINSEHQKRKNQSEENNNLV